MNIEQLRQFEAIAKTGTMTAAAEQLHITQPALSRSMARLEADLGADLFERNGRSVSLSREGEVALEYARSILHEERLMRSALGDLAKKRSLKASDLAGETFLLYENVGFWGEGVRRALPHSDFIIQEDYAVFEQLAAGFSALSFVSDAPYQRRDVEGYVRIPFEDPCATASFYLLARADGPSLARKILERIEFERRSDRTE